MSVRSGSLSGDIGVKNYAQSGLSLTLTYTDSSTSDTEDINIDFIGVNRWLEFEYRYSTSILDNELLTVEVDCNEQTLSQDYSLESSSSVINTNFAFSGLTPASVFNFAVRFKRKIGSTWFQV